MTIPADNGSGGMTVGDLATQSGGWQQKADLADWLVEYISGQRPDPKDFTVKQSDGSMTNSEGLTYSLALGVWVDQLNSATSTASQLRDFSSGFVTLPDGTGMPIGDLPPEQRAALEAANNNVFAKFANDFQLSGYKIQAGAAQQNFDNQLAVSDRGIAREQADFNNRVTATGERMKYDDLRLKKAEDELSRQLSGMQESRSRSDLIANTQLAAAPYGTKGGKTAFSASDIGGVASAFAGRLGLDPGQSLLNYTGTSMVDPQAQMAQYDAQFGTQGALPAVPSLLTAPEDLQGAPTFTTPIPGAPTPPPVPSLLAPQQAPSLLLRQAQPASAPSAQYDASGAIAAAAQKVRDLLSPVIGTSKAARNRSNTSLGGAAMKNSSAIQSALASLLGGGGQRTLTQQHGLPAWQPAGVGKVIGPNGGR